MPLAMADYIEYQVIWILLILQGAEDIIDIFAFEYLISFFSITLSLLIGF